MTNPDYRAMCAELVELCTPVDSIPQLAERLQKLNALADRARALLAEPVAEWEPMPLPGDAEGLAEVFWAQPVAEGPSADELIGLALGREPWATWLRSGGCLESAHCELADLMLAALARWGRPTPQPVAVSERLPGPEDCDELETCWQWEPDINGHHPLGLWELVHRDWVSDPDSDTTHWLPANALPTPEATND